MPERIQRKRAKGWRMPEGAIYVGRPGKWGNDFIAWQRCYDHHAGGFVQVGDAADAVARYRRMCERWLRTDRSRYHAFDAIRGKDLACWCPLDQPCHADVLLELANRPVLDPDKDAP